MKRDRLLDWVGWPEAFLAILIVIDYVIFSPRPPGLLHRFINFPLYTYWIYAILSIFAQLAAFLLLFISYKKSVKICLESKMISYKWIFCWVGGLQYTFWLVWGLIFDAGDSSLITTSSTKIDDEYQFVLGLNVFALFYGAPFLLDRLFKYYRRSQQIGTHIFTEYQNYTPFSFNLRVLPEKWINAVQIYNHSKSTNVLIEIQAQIENKNTNFHSCLKNENIEQFQPICIIKKGRNDKNNCKYTLKILIREKNNNWEQIVHQITSYLENFNFSPENLSYHNEKRNVAGVH